MKFGQKYNETLAGLSPEMRANAIQYKSLKKVIKRVANELSELGLTSEVLKDLLENGQESIPPPAISELSPGEAAKAVDVTRAGPSSGRTTPTPARVQAAKAINGRTKADGDSSEDEDEAEAFMDGLKKDIKGKSVDKGKGKVKRKRRAHATYEFAGTHEHPEPRIRIVFSSASSESVSDDSANGLLDSQSSDTSTLSELTASSRANTRDTSPIPGPRITELNSSESEAASPKLGSEADKDETSSVGTDEPELEFEGAGPQANSLLRRMYGHKPNSDEEEELRHNWSEVGVEIEPKRRRSDETVRDGDFGISELRVANEEASAEGIRREKQAMVDSISGSDGVEADDEATPTFRPRRRRHHHRTHKKEVFIPLNHDTEFLTLLAQAFSSLAEIQLRQKQNFTQAVELLAREVSKVSSPSKPKTDLYVWREIFSLWVEAQVFESRREKDRGDRDTQEIEKKLDWFVGQVAARKLANKMKHKESRIALEKFIKLNVELLDLKKFQLANEEAARKILKKHDKRTALTASLGFPQFISAASQLSGGTLSNSPGLNNNTQIRVLTLPGLPSLPHVLLSTFTSTLLPVIPQIEDYECAICGDVAFKPIRLDCGHKFCVRCLIKMQKRGQDNCPHCRQAVVLRADGRNLDTAMQAYLKLWFPKEIKAKEKENRKEAAREEIEEMGLNADHKCVVM